MPCSALCPSVVKLLAVVLLACLTAPLSPAPAEAEQDCVPVHITRVRTADLEQTIQGIGTLEAAQEVMLKPEIAGIVQQIHFQEGSRVGQGELLVSMEDDMYRARLRAQQAALRQAQAEMANQKRVFRRRQKLYSQNQISEEARDEAETKLETSQARVNRLQAEMDQIQETLEDTTLRAPFDGLMGERLVDPGNWVDVGTPLAAVIQSDPLHIAFTLPERFIGQVAAGQTARVRVPAYPDRTFKGRVFFVSPQIAQSSRSLLVKAELKNPKGTLRPGGFASVQLKVGVRQGVMVIPEEALVPTRTGYMVFAVSNGRAHGRDVSLGLRKPGQVEITQGLEVGQRIIRTGHINVHEGAKVCPAQE